ncbi:interleukin-20-like [Acipenser oxyrinchus oxyrinchus]|uniref:Interleukin family protein n=1 Tax=Acipenser oxyrinchus oxyrinchus TaxID=40147 RepID=A0AAD8CEN3_ACIOX|nr:interleukin-20-like [Acipenser oxyrinchus oxyrinchus]KAK1144171.1 interleukin-20-like [Acipenser oxyrinchus oxyrinchus]
MKFSGSFLYLVALALLVHGVPAAMGRRLHFGKCVVSVQIHELREYFSEIRKTIVGEDGNSGVRLLKEHAMKNIKPLESCCFLRQLLRFYVESVFNRYTPKDSQIRRRTSSLANSFLSINRDLRQCNAHLHCQCDEETKKRIEAIQSTFEKLDVSAATVKAIGELDYLLDWIETHHHH